MVHCGIYDGCIVGLWPIAKIADLVTREALGVHGDFDHLPHGSVRGILDSGLVVTIGRLLVGCDTAVYFCGLDPCVHCYVVDLWTKYKLPDIQGLLHTDWNVILNWPFNIFPFTTYFWWPFDDFCCSRISWNCGAQTFALTIINEHTGLFAGSGQN